MDFSSLFGPVAQTINTIITALYELTAKMCLPSYGLAIIIFTIVLKALMYPLTVKQIRSMKAMSGIQPKMKKLQDQYQNDPMRLQAEMKKLWSEAGVSPLDGCLPLLIQMPILMAIYYALQSLTYEGESSFLWMPSLSSPDPLYILPVLSAATTYIVSSQTTDKNNTQMKYMTYFMPLFVGYISLQFAAGLIVYWITMNVVQIFQQWFMQRNDKPDKKKDASDAKTVEYKDYSSGTEKEAKPADDDKAAKKSGKKLKKIRRPKK